jgi:hypothetical protein
VPLLPCLLQAWPLASHAAAVPYTQACSHAAGKRVPRTRAWHCNPRPCHWRVAARRVPHRADDTPRLAGACDVARLCRTSGKNPGWFSGLGSMGMLGQVHWVTFGPLTLSAH